MESLESSTFRSHFEAAALKLKRRKEFNLIVGMTLDNAGERVATGGTGGNHCVLTVFVLKN
jgi:hypothetical protein